MEQHTLPTGKWEAKASTGLANASADQIWPLFADFFGFYKWFPGLICSDGIHKKNGELGCIRHCIVPPIGKDCVEQYANQKLTAIDPTERTLSYVITDGNVGFNSYVATFKIVPISGKKGCLIEWEFAVDPIDGWNFEGLVKRFEYWLQHIAKKMEDAILQSDG